MHPSTTAIITATEYTNGIFLQIHMFRFFMDLCIHWNACHEYYYFASLGIFMHQGCRMQRLTKSLHIFCMDKRLLEDFFKKWKYWMSFIACGCHFSRSYTVYSWLSKGWLLGIFWTYQTVQYDFPESPPNNSLLLLNSQCPKQPLLNQLYMWVYV